MKGILNNLTLHQRLAILIGGSLLTLGFILVLFVNLIALLLISHDMGISEMRDWLTNIDAESASIIVLREIPTLPGYVMFPNSGVTSDKSITIIRYMSLAGLAMIAGAGFLAARGLARIALRPVVHISQKAKRINAKSLNQRLSYQGPQDELKDLADTLDAMLARLDTDFERQSQFIGNLAHELRTPLTSLRMNIEALNADSTAALKDYQELTNKAERALSRFDGLVEDLLLLAKGEKEIAHQPIILGALLEEILDEVTPIAQEHGIMLKMDGDTECEIWGDAVLLECALSNLVENGVLYNRPGGFVEIFVRREDQLAVIEFCDNGIGIATGDQTKIFERFYRARQAPDCRYTGRGLGLAIVKHVVELHQGSIEVESELGLGSTFRIFIPYSSER